MRMHRARMYADKVLDAYGHETAHLSPQEQLFAAGLIIKSLADTAMEIAEELGSVAQTGERTDSAGSEEVDGAIPSRSTTNPHEKWLRMVAAEIALAGHNGWGNTCLQAADEIANLERAISHDTV